MTYTDFNRVLQRSVSFGTAKGTFAVRALSCCSTLLLLACGASNSGTRANVEGVAGSGGAAAIAGSSAIAAGSGGTDFMSGTSGGGSSSSGTSTGGSQPVQPPVKKCDGLAAAGIWESVTPPRVNENKTFTGALMPIVNPITSAVYVMTDGNGVFRSADCGSSWQKMNTGRNADKLDSGRIWAAIMDPVNPDTLYALTGYGAGGLWKTTNGGVDWDQILPAQGEVATSAGGFVERVAMDPDDQKHLLINFHNNCGGSHTPVCFAESKDAGGTWTLRDFPKELSGSWGEGSGMVLLSSKVWLYGQGNLFRTTDAGATWAQIPAGADYPCFPGDSRITKTPDGALYLGVSQGVIRSTDNGATWTALPNSGRHICSVIGDGKRLFAFTSDNPQQVFSASYADVMTWAKLDTPGLSEDLSQYVYVVAYDSSHHLLYAAAQAGGVFRVVTQ